MSRAVRSRRPVAALAAMLLLAACAGRGADEPGPSRSSARTESPATPATPATAPDSTAAAAPTTARATAGPASPASTPPLPSAPQVSVVAGRLQVPWEIAFAPDGTAYVSERQTGAISALSPDGRRAEVRRIAEVVPAGEGGLLGLAVSPRFAEDGLLYAYYTAAGDNRVVRFRAGGGGAAEVIVSGIPKAGNHNGGRIAFGPDGKLYIGTGDAAVPGRARDLGSLGGKILRVEPDGAVPADNPFPASPVWSSGHRNVQGLAWDARGRLWATELGPDRDDEINLIVRGGDYGWPQATGTARHDGSRAASAVKQPPEAAWSGLAFVSARDMPEWGDSLIAAGLRGRRLWRFPVTADGRLGQGQPLLQDRYGRLRAVVRAADGSLWISTSNRDGRGSPSADDDRILRYGR
jgi:glucose/arabinose dehydrogenase